MGDDGLGSPKVPGEKVFLAQNSPNPFNPTTSVSFYLAEPSHIELTVFDVAGRRVSTLSKGFRGNGSHTVEWTTADLPSGVYFLKLEAAGTDRIRKAVLLK